MLSAVFPEPLLLYIFKRLWYARMAVISLIGAHDREAVQTFLNLLISAGGMQLDDRCLLGCPILFKIHHTFLSKNYVVYKRFGFQSFPASSLSFPQLAQKILKIFIIYKDALFNYFILTQFFSQIRTTELLTLL
jgi:hypothetical protein